MKTKLFLVLFLFVTFGLTAQENKLSELMQDRNEYYFTFELNGNDNLQKIAQTISVDRVDGNPAGIKALMAHAGLCKNVLRLPLVPVSDNVRQAIENEYKSL